MKEIVKKRLCMAFHYILFQEEKIVNCSQLAHWNIEGTEFFSLHKMFNEHYDEFFAEIDNIAETIRKLGFKVDKRIVDKLWKKYPVKKEFSCEENPVLLAYLLACEHDEMLKLIKTAIEICNDSPYFESEKNYLGELQGKHKKAKWFLKSTAK